MTEEICSSIQDFVKEDNKKDIKKIIQSIPTQAQQPIEEEKKEVIPEISKK